MSKPPRKSRSTELGLELICTRCQEYWPADSQFFYRSERDGHGWHSWCIACCNGRKYEERAVAGTLKRHPAALPARVWSPLLTWSSRPASQSSGATA